MIFKLTFIDDNRVEFAQAPTQLDLLQSYDRDYNGFQDIESVQEISEEESKNITIKNTDYEEGSDEPETFSLYDMVIGDDFSIIASSEWE